MDPTSTLEFLGVLVDSQNMTLTLPQQKVAKIKTQCKELSEKSLVTVRELRKLIGPLSSTAVAALPAHLQRFTTPANLGNDFQIFSRGTIESIKTGIGRAKLVDTTSQSVQWEALNSPPPAQLIKSLNASIQG